MAVEIERRFLVKANKIELDQNCDLAECYQQIYLKTGPVQIRSGRRFRPDTNDFSDYDLGIKFGHGVEREEIEYDLPIRTGELIFSDLNLPLLSKTRYYFDTIYDLCWEVDCFHGKLDGLIIAEIELPDKNHVLPNFPSSVKIDIIREITDFVPFENQFLAGQDSKYVMDSLLELCR